MLMFSICAVLAAAPNAQLAQAEQHIAAVRYADAEKALAAAWATPNNPRETTLRILELQGIVASVLGKPKAREFFRQLLSLDPERKLPEGQPPRVRTPFYEAKGISTEAAPMKFSASAQVGSDGVKLSAQLSADPLSLARKVRFHTRVSEAIKQNDVALTALSAAWPAGYGSILWWAELLGENDAVLLVAGKPEQPFLAQGPELKTPVAVAAAVAPVTPQPEPAPAIADPVVSAAPSRPVLVPVLLWGGAAVALASGIVLGAMSSGSYAQVNNAPKDGSGVITGMTQQQAASLRDAGRGQAVAANILYVSAVALAGAGVLVFLLSSPPAQVAIAPAPGGVVVGGTF